MLTVFLEEQLKHLGKLRSTLIYSLVRRKQWLSDLLKISTQLVLQKSQDSDLTKRFLVRGILSQTSLCLTHGIRDPVRKHQDNAYSESTRRSTPKRAPWGCSLMVLCWVLSDSGDLGRPNEAEDIPENAQNIPNRTHSHCCIPPSLFFF